MSPRPADDQRAAALSALGLPPDADDDAIEEARERLAAQLAAVDSLGSKRRGKHRRDGVTETRPSSTASAADPAVRVDAASEPAEAVVDVEQPPQPMPAAPAKTGKPRRRRHDDEDDDGTYVDVERIGASPATPAEAPATTKPTATAARPAKGAGTTRTLLMAVLAGLLVAGVWAVYTIGAPKPTAASQPPGHPQVGSTAGGNAGQPGAQATSAPTLDQAKVDALKGQLESDPNNTELLNKLADEYFKAQQWPEVQKIQERVLALKPDDVDTLLALGVAEFNQENYDGAGKHWNRAAEVNPNSADAHFNLGFLALAKEPPDMATVEREWKRVIEIDPRSDIAQTARDHLDRLTASPTPRKS